MSAHASHLKRRHGTGNVLLFLTVLPITPLVDVSLVLLVFMIAAADVGRVTPTALPVALPRAGTGQAAPAQPFTVGIDRVGTVRLAGTAVTPEQLAIAARGARQAVIAADAKVAHGTVVGVVDVLRKAGVQEISYAAAPGVVEW